MKRLHTNLAEAIFVISLCVHFNFPTNTVKHSEMLTVPYKKFLHSTVSINT